MPLGTRIRKAREQARMSQAELARRIGISSTSMNAIEGGHTDPRASRIVAIARELGVSTDTLLLGTAATRTCVQAHNAAHAAPQDRGGGLGG